MGPSWSLRGASPTWWRLVLIAALVGSAALSLLGQAAAQLVFTPPRVTGTPNPVGSGARALGWGNAFIAVADDATAASWNPAGLIQLELPEWSVVGALPLRSEELDGFERSTSFPGGLERKSFLSSDNDVSIANLNYLSAALPFRLLGINFTGALNYQELFDFNRTVKLDERTTRAGGTPTDFTQLVTFRQDGSLKTITPALAAQITPRLSAGVALNFWTDQGLDDRKITRTTIGQINARLGGTTPQFQRVAFNEGFSNWEGFNLNLGMLWNLSNEITLGAVVKTPVKFTSDVSVNVASRTDTPSFATSANPALRARATLTSQRSQHFSDVEMEFPLSYGVGIAYRFSDAFSLAFDVFRTEWGDFERDGIVTAPVVDPATGSTTLVAQQGRFGADNLPLRAPAGQESSDVQATWQLRFGGEYLFILEKTIIPIRAGIFYDPEPSHRQPRDYYGFALGTGISLGNIILDAAYQFRFGGGFAGSEFGLSPETEVDQRQHTFYLSMIYHFE